MSVTISYYTIREMGGGISYGGAKQKEILLSSSNRYVLKQEFN